MNYRKVSVTLVVKADNEAEMCDGISETLRSLDPEWLLDWSYTNLLQPSLGAETMEFDPATYEEGDAFPSAASLPDSVQDGEYTLEPYLIESTAMLWRVRDTDGGIVITGCSNERHASRLLHNRLRDQIGGTSA